MLLGHYGAAFGFKSADRRISLGTLFIAANLPDILWCILLVLGIEKTEIVPGFTKWVPLKGVYAPFSHGVAGVLALALLFGLFLWTIGRIRKSKFPDIKASAILALLVLSHIIIDIPVHIKEIPLFYADGIKLGLGLWNYPIVSNALELGILVAGVALYLKPWKNIRKALPVIVFSLLLVVYHFVNGLVPPPEGMSTTQLGISVLGGIIILSAIAEWIDRRFCR